jgi:hypothetical protein
LVGLPALGLLWTATLQQAEALAIAKAGHQSDWWRPLEACLAAIDCDAVTDAVEDEKDAKRPAPIDVELLLTKILPDLISDPCERAREPQFDTNLYVQQRHSSKAGLSSLPASLPSFALPAWLANI